MKVGLIAMSGIRVQDQELLELGLTIPGFVERSKLIASLPSLGLLTLAGLTDDSVDYEYLEVPELADLGDDLPGGDFDLVAISSFSAKIEDAYQLADRYRAAGVRVVLGGLHVTACPDEAMAHADAVVIGEGEPVWNQVVADAAKGRMKKRYDARATKFDFADAPMPRFDLLDISKYNRLTVQTQRGCPWKCDFCASSIRLDPKFKTKPMEKIAAEITAIKEIWPKPFIEFADDNTFADKRHGHALCETIGGEGFRWFTESDISVAEDKDLLKLIKDSGCAQILIGLESPVATALDGVEIQANWKLKQHDRYRKAIARIQDAGITVNGCFVLGLDGLGQESFDAVFEFVESTGLYEVQLTVMTAFPGTPLYQKLKTANRLIDPRAWERCTLFDINYLPTNMSVDELREGFQQLIVKLYDEDRIQERRRRFFARQWELE